MVQLMKATGPVFPSRFHKVENVYINNQLRPVNVIDVANSNFCLAYFSPALNLMLGLFYSRREISKSISTCHFMWRNPSNTSTCNVALNLKSLVQ